MNYIGRINEQSNALYTVHISLKFHRWYTCCDLLCYNVSSQPVCDNTIEFAYCLFLHNKSQCCLIFKTKKKISVRVNECSK